MKISQQKWEQSVNQVSVALTGTLLGGSTLEKEISAVEQVLRSLHFAHAETVRCAVSACSHMGADDFIRLLNPETIRVR